MPMNYWMCSNCSYVFETEAPPESCPDCREKCTFTNVTCYIPDCGGPEHLDPRLVAQRAREEEAK